MRKILIIEDNKDLAGAIEGLLKLKGFETFLARDGVSGIEQARKHKPDLVLLDIMLPKLNGFEVCRMLKTDSALRHIPVLVMSTLSASDDIDRAMECGAKDFINKPYDLEEVIKKILALLK